MRLRLGPLASLALTTLLLHTSVPEAKAQEPSKPLLSEEIRRVLVADGPEVDESGKPIALIHDMDDLGLPSRLESVEPPWEPECLPVERRG